MKVVLVGGGGREAALAWRMAREASRLVVLAENPGWPAEAERREGDPVEVACEVEADLVVVGPEAPLAEGLADRLAEARIPCFGPSRAAARLEASKAFAKDVMRAAGVPTADAVAVTPSVPGELEAARRRCDAGRVVLKADGLAAGKGVFVCPTAEEAHRALEEIRSGRFGAAAERVLLEDLLEGPEVSLFALCDGERVVALPSSQDHKRLLDGDAGPNTGGMGAYAPCPLVGPGGAEDLVRRVHLPVVREMARRGVPFRGVLYAGLMLTEAGPRILEFNVRFGDPECQPLMCLWEGPLLPWLHGAATGALPPGRPRFAAGASCCVVLASPAYPVSSTRGIPIPEPPPTEGVVVFHAATRRVEGRLVTHGGRVLGVTGTGPDLEVARERAYAAAEGWRFEGAQLRTDIGLGGLS